MTAMMVPVSCSAAVSNVALCVVSVKGQQLNTAMQARVSRVKVVVTVTERTKHVCQLALTGVILPCFRQRYFLSNAITFEVSPA